MYINKVKALFAVSQGEKAAMSSKSSLAVQTQPWFLLVELYYDLLATFHTIEQYLAEGCCAGLYFIIQTLDCVRESNNRFIIKITRTFICSHNTVTFKTQITSDMDLIVSKKKQYAISEKLTETFDCHRF